jgi:ubiquinone/menaquinone biosynthesis C-methylase UbiE
MFHPDGPTFWELAEQALSSTERGYDLLAPKFDVTPFRTPDAVLARVIERVAGDGAPRRALDLCCGTGAAMRWLRPICAEAVVGLDLSQGMLDEAKRRLADAPGDAAVELVRGDALSPPFRREFDLVTCFGAFGHILPEDEPRFVDAVAQVLVPSGRFVFVTSELPPITSPARLFARAFNAAMRVRNALFEPAFVMYYLTFLLPDAARLLERRGFEVTIVRDAFEAPFGRLALVSAAYRG